MKNVAATSGQSVSLAALFLCVESIWGGTWAGNDTLLNFYSRPPWAPFARDATGRANSQRKNTRSAPARNRKIQGRHRPQKENSVGLAPALFILQIFSGALFHESRSSTRPTPVPFFCD